MSHLDVVAARVIAVVPAMLLGAHGYGLIMAYRAGDWVSCGAMSPGTLLFGFLLIITVLIDYDSPRSNDNSTREG